MFDLISGFSLPSILTGYDIIVGCWLWTCPNGQVFPCKWQPCQCWCVIRSGDSKLWNKEWLWSGEFYQFIIIIFLHWRSYDNLNCILISLFFSQALALLGEHIDKEDPSIRIGAVMGLGIAYAGTQNEQVKYLVALCE